MPWLAAFLVLTIAGERLELSRLVPRSPAAQTRFVVAAAIFVAGVVLTVVLPDAGRRIGGIGLLAMAAWLARHDLPLADLRAGRQNLEDVFLRLTAAEEDAEPDAERRR